MSDPTEDMKRSEEAQSPTSAEDFPESKKPKLELADDPSADTEQNKDRPGTSKDFGGEIKKNDQANASETSQKQFSSFEMLTGFDELVEDQPINIGTYEVNWVEYIPYGENAGLTVPVMNIVFMDAQKHKSVFTAYGDHAKNWSHVEVAQVLQLENFDWRKDVKNKSRFYGFTSPHCGFLNEQASFIINKELSTIFAQYRAQKIDHINSFGEINNDHDKMVLTLDVKMQKEVIRCKDQVRRSRLLYLFSTSDGIQVELTAFEKNCELMEQLEEEKAYIIENVTPYENPARPSDRLQFSVTAHTKFIMTAFHKTITPTQKISLLDVSSGNFTKDTIYEIEGFARQKSVYFPKLHMSQCVIFDESSTSDITNSAMIHFVDSQELLNGQRINIKCHIIETHNAHVLDVIPGTLTIMAESFPVDKIGQKKFHIA